MLQEGGLAMEGLQGTLTAILQPQHVGRPELAADLHELSPNMMFLSAVPASAAAATNCTSNSVSVVFIIAAVQTRQESWRVTERIVRSPWFGTM